VIQVQRIGVVDTDVLIDDLEALARGDFDQAVLAQPSGTTRWLASTHVFEEMYRPDKLGNSNKFEKLARQSVGEVWAASSGELRLLFETRLLPNIRFVDVTGVRTRSPQPSQPRIRRMLRQVNSPP
jgi:hypothetical protein